MIEIGIKAPIGELTRFFDSMQKNQVPWATSLTIARLGNLSRDSVVKAMSTVFDRPTPFALKGVRVAWDSRDKENPRYRVFLNEWAAKGTAPVKYLYPEVEGGPRNVTRFERALQFAGVLPAGMSVVPGQGAPRDAFGNVANGFHAMVLSRLHASTDPMQNETVKSKRRKGRAYKVDLFVGRPGGGRLPLGIYQRLGVRPLFIFIQRKPMYRKRLPFYELVQEVVKTQLDSTFAKAFEEAMRTAK